MGSSQKWRLLKGITVASEPVLPGVWRRRAGGMVVLGKAKDRRTGKRREVFRVLPEATGPEAFTWLQERLREIRTGTATPAGKGPQSTQVRGQVAFGDYGRKLLERKVAAGDIRSAAGRRKWETCLRRLIASPLGDLRIGVIESADIMAWRDDAARAIQAGVYKPGTLNTDRAILRLIMKSAKWEFGLANNPTEGLPPFDRSQHPTYTREQPNSLTPEELRRFLEKMRVLFPQYYALVTLGFSTGLRPSTMRPLRRRGAETDVLWDEGKLLIRRSNSEGKEVMHGTKIGSFDEIDIPEELMAVLEWHVQTQLKPGPQQESDLLFPSELGGFRSRSCLDVPFRRVAEAIGLKKHVTPRAMRRTFSDSARAAEVRDLVAQSISGHRTESMVRRYSTVNSSEQREGLTKVLQLMGCATVPANQAGTPSHVPKQNAGAQDQNTPGETSTAPSRNARRRDARRVQPRPRWGRSWGRSGRVGGDKKGNGARRRRND